MRRAGNRLRLDACRLRHAAVDAYPAMVERGDFSSLPAHMAGSAAEAADVYARTGDPQQIDLILDRACFADMLDTAQGEYSRDLVRCKIDLTI